MTKVRWVVTILMVLALVSVASVSFGKGKKGGGKKGADAPVADATAPAAAVTTTVSATVTKSADGKVTVTIDLPTDASTQVSIGGEGNKALSDLKAGQSVQVTFMGSTVVKIDATK